MKTLTDRLSRALLVLRGARAALPRSTAWHCRSRTQRKARARLRQWSTDTLAASFVGGGMSRSAPADARAGSCFTDRASKRRKARLHSHTFAAPLACTIRPPIPLEGGFGMHLNITPRNYAQCCARHCRAEHRPLSPHNPRYVEVHAQRAQTLAVRSGEAPQCRSPAHPLRGVRSRATVARCLQHRSRPPPPKGAPSESLRSLRFASGRSRALRAASRAASAPSAEDGACHGRCNPDRLSGV